MWWEKCVERERTVHRKKKPAFGGHVFGQFLCVIRDRVEREGPHAWWEFRVPFAIRDSDGALERNFELFSASAADSDDVFGFAVGGALFECAVQGFWGWDHWSRGLGVLVLDEGHGVGSVGVARWVKDLVR